MYSLDGLKDGERYCVVPSDGAWDVVFMERGRVIAIASGLTKNSAYDCLYGELKKSYGWPD